VNEPQSGWALRYRYLLVADGYLTSAELIEEAFERMTTAERETVPTPPRGRWGRRRPKMETN
jgi:hypothetical protein